MLNQIETAFAALDAKLIAADQEWAAKKMDTTKEAVAQLEADFKAGKYPHLTSGYGRFDHSMAVAFHFGSKSMAALLTGHGRDGGLANMRKNTEALIAKRNANIVKSLTKVGITELPEFELEATTDGYEGTFKVGNHIVTIRTIIAGGYNVQRLHQRTITKVR